jgi:hypothetical protein
VQKTDGRSNSLERLRSVIALGGLSLPTPRSSIVRLGAFSFRIDDIAAAIVRQLRFWKGCFDVVVMTGVS